MHPLSSLQTTPTPHPQNQPMVSARIFTNQDGIKTLPFSYSCKRGKDLITSTNLTFLKFPLGREWGESSSTSFIYNYTKSIAGEEVMTNCLPQELSELEAGKLQMPENNIWYKQPQNPLPSQAGKR